MKTLIKNVTVLTMDKESSVYKDGCVLIDGKEIAYAGPEKDFAADKVVDGEGGILMPGMINTHSHLSMIPFRSMGDDCADRLRRFLFPLENDAMGPQLAYQAARYAVCELLLSGVTSIVDMYYFEDLIAKACKELGIRSWLGETIINQKTPDAENTEDSLAYTEKYIQNWLGDELVHPCVAPHATNTLTKEQLIASKELAKKYGVKYTLHVSEMEYEMKYFQETYGKSPIEFLQEIGALDKDTIAAHCIHMSEKDIRIMAETGAKIASNIAANTKSGKGIPPIYEALQAGVDVGLGTDGPSSGNTLDIITQMRLVPYFQKTKYHNRSIMTAKEVVTLATMGGAKVVGAEKEIGSIEVGKKADLVLVETKSANMFPAYNPYSVLVYSANPGNVDSVWVNGTQLVEGKKLLCADLAAEREALTKEMAAFIAASEQYKEYI